MIGSVILINMIAAIKTTISSPILPMVLA